MNTREYRNYIKRVTAKDEASANISDDNDGDPPASGPSSGDLDVDADAAPKATSRDEALRRVTAEEAVRHDRKRKKTRSNDDWASSTAEDACITRMKNVTTRLAYKVEHVVDMETVVILAAVLRGNEHDAGTLESSLTAAENNLVAAGAAPAIVDGRGSTGTRHQSPRSSPTSATQGLRAPRSTTTRLPDLHPRKEARAVGESSLTRAARLQLERFMRTEPERGAGRAKCINVDEANSP